MFKGLLTGDLHTGGEEFQGLSMLRFAPRMSALLLSASMLAGCASMTSSKVASSDHTADTAPARVERTTPTDLDGGVRQAQLMRNAGQYDDAIRVLSQLMLVASDDPRVVSEYGKTLAQKGRAQEAVEFLNRAIELSSNDWTLYSALGVSYDQLGNQPAARAAYEHALTLRPEEPSVLNNYALSRMLAGDADGARVLIGRAQAAGGASDSKIAANIALLNKVAPTPNNQQNAAAMAAPHAEAPSPAPATQNLSRLVPPSPQPVAQAAPHSLVASLPPRTEPASPVAAGRVVMQNVPVDSHAGPVAVHPAKVAAAPKADTSPQVAVARPVSAKPINTKPIDAKIAAAPKAAAQVAAGKPVLPQTGTPINVKTVDAKTAAAPKPGSPEQAAAIYLALKGMDAKDDAKPPVKTADAKPDAKSAKPVPVKADALSQVPALRMTADARSP
jgi:Flp pilus assembly protein TadD